MKILNSAVSWIEQLPYSLSSGFSISIIECVIIYSIIILLILFIVYKRTVFLQLTMFTTTLLFLGFIMEKWYQKNQNLLVIYSIRNDWAIDLIQGNDHSLLANSALLGNESKMQFHLQNHWSGRGIHKHDTLLYSDSVIEKGNLFAYHHFYSFNDFRIFHWDTTTKIRKSDQKVKVNAILISNNSKIDKTILDNNFELEQIIFDGTNSGYYIQKMKEELGSKYLIRDLNEEGAFQKEFK